MREVLWTGERDRVVAVYAPDLGPPEGDCYCPAIVIDSRHVQGEQYLEGITVGRILNAFDEMGHDVEMFERWARVFHGVNAKVIEANSTFICWPSKSWEAMIGNRNYEPSESDVAELDAYLEGWVYYLEHQQVTIYVNEDDERDVLMEWNTVDGIGTVYNELMSDAEIIDALDMAEYNFENLPTDELSAYVDELSGRAETRQNVAA